MQFVWQMVINENGKFQYRKRYGLHAIFADMLMINTIIGFNTASGMDCMQSKERNVPVIDVKSFNTASGMDCMQSDISSTKKPTQQCFNTASGMDCMQFAGFIVVATAV